MTAKPCAKRSVPSRSQVSAEPAVYEVQRSCSFKGIRRVEVPAERIDPA